MRPMVLVRLFAVALAGGVLAFGFKHVPAMRRLVARHKALPWVLAVPWLATVFFVIGFDLGLAIICAIVAVISLAAWKSEQEGLRAIVERARFVESVKRLLEPAKPEPQRELEPEVHVTSAVGTPIAFLIAPAPGRSGVLATRFAKAPERPRTTWYRSVTEARQAAAHTGAVDADWPQLGGQIVWRRWRPVRRLSAILTNLWVCRTCMGDAIGANAVYQLLWEVGAVPAPRSVADRIAKGLLPCTHAWDCSGYEKGPRVPHCRFSSAGLTEGLPAELQRCLQELKDGDGALRSDVPGQPDVV